MSKTLSSPLIRDILSEINISVEDYAELLKQI